MSKERWLPIVGFNGRYEVSSHGRVRSNGTVLKPVVTSHRYLRVSVLGRYPRYVHDLVARAFIGPKPRGMEVAHEDGSRDNNVVDNLRWKTHADNNRDMRRHGTLRLGIRHQHAKLDDDKVRYIRKVAIPGDALFGYNALARRLKLTVGAISNAARKVTWRHVS